ncbi:MAG: hypothetical protein MUP55_02040 [Candidatus Aenigmarchaeota archaeon]|nr:hypothetical protein [Candidatus Aenigmarchaeota archaeon]
MPKKIDESTRLRIREAVGTGMSRYEAAKAVNVDLKTAYKYTKDMLIQQHKERTNVTEQMRRTVRKSVEAGVSTDEAAEEVGISVPTARRITKDMPDGRKKTHIRGWTLTFLRIIFNEDYFIANRSESGRTKKAFRFLKERGFPIAIAQVDRKTVYFHDIKRKEAHDRFMEGYLAKNKRIDYTEACRIQNAFGISKNRYKEPKSGKFPAENRLENKVKSKKRALKTTVSDYFGRFLHSELMR